MEKYADVFCPMTKRGCAAQCAWYCDGKCALTVVSERLVDVTTAINGIKWELKNVANER